MRARCDKSCRMLAHSTDSGDPDRDREVLCKGDMAANCLDSSCYPVIDGKAAALIVLGSGATKRRVRVTPFPFHAGMASA